MASDSEKDRLGDKLRDAERAREDVYFAERDRKLVAEMRKARGGAAAAEAVAGMHCPKCRAALQASIHGGVAVEECPTCRGMWLGHGESKEIASRENNGWIARWLRREFQQDE